MMICFHIDNCKISHLDPKVGTYAIAWLCDEYESISTNGSGMMKVAPRQGPQMFGHAA